jgi:uncharacterized protein YjbI with pentapeptide repeats
MSTPEFHNDDPLYRLLREEKISEFNNKVAEGIKLDFTHLDFRGLDLRGLEPGTVTFINCYFRQTDMRGVDFSKSNLDGASICCAKISGVRFPDVLTPAEIQMSLAHGTRMRNTKRPVKKVVKRPAA